MNWWNKAFGGGSATNNNAKATSTADSKNNNNASTISRSGSSISPSSIVPSINQQPNRAQQDGERLVQGTYRLMSMLQFNHAIDFIKKKHHHHNHHHHGDVRGKEKALEALRTILFMFARCESMYYTLSFGVDNKKDLHKSYAYLLNVLSKLIVEMEMEEESRAASGKLHSHHHPGTHQQQQQAQAQAQAQQQYQHQHQHQQGDFVWDMQLLKQSRIWVQLRLELVSLYRMMGTTVAPPAYDEYCEIIYRLRQKYVVQFSHPFIRGMARNVKFELDILYAAFRLENCIGTYQYKDAMFLLWESKQLIKAWNEAFIAASSSSSPPHNDDLGGVGDDPLVMDFNSILTGAANQRPQGSMQIHQLNHHVDMFFGSSEYDSNNEDNSDTMSTASTDTSTGTPTSAASITTTASTLRINRDPAHHPHQLKHHNPNNLDSGFNNNMSSSSSYLSKSGYPAVQRQQQQQPLPPPSTPSSHQQLLQPDGGNITIPASSSSASSSSSSNALTQCLLYKWMSMLLSFSLSKATFYFYAIHKNREEKLFGGDVNQFCMASQKVGINYLTWIESFIKWTSPLCVCLIYDTQGEPFAAHGYEPQPESPSGISSYPCIFCALNANALISTTTSNNNNAISGNTTPPPGGSGGGGGTNTPTTSTTIMMGGGNSHQHPILAQHWPNLISIVMDNRDTLQHQIEPYYHLEERAATTTIRGFASAPLPQSQQQLNETPATTYFLSCVDARMYLCVIFNDRKKRNDKMVCEFMYSTSLALRNKKVCSALNN